MLADLVKLWIFQGHNRVILLFKYHKKSKNLPPY